MWADYVELLCLANQDGSVSKADLIDRILERRSIEIPDEAEGVPGAGGTRADRLRGEIDDIFRHLEFRVGAFETAYPFVVSRRTTLGRRRPTARRSLYVFLLLSANLRYIPTNRRSALSTEFERFSLRALRRWLAPAATIHPFGTASPSGSRYSGPKLARIERLAQDLGETVQPDIELRPGDSGDGGADIVGWFPTGDRNPSHMSFLAQATCLSDWTDHQHHASFEAWRPFISFTAIPVNVLLIPQCFRKADGSWFMRHQIRSSVLIDRVRLQAILAEKPLTLGASATALVQDALEYREALV